MGKFYVETSLGMNVTGGYVQCIGEYGENEAGKNIFDFDLTQYDLSGNRIFAYILREDSLEFDQEEYDRIVEEEEEQEAKRKPSWNETIEAQVTWTALMTDTLLEPEEEEEE